MSMIATGACANMVSYEPSLSLQGRGGDPLRQQWGGEGIRRAGPFPHPPTASPWAPPSPQMGEGWERNGRAPPIPSMVGGQPQLLGEGAARAERRAAARQRRIGHEIM